MPSLLRRILNVLDRRQRWRFAGLLAASSLNAFLEVASLGLVFTLVLAVVAPDDVNTGGFLKQLLTRATPADTTLPLMAGIAVIVIYGLKSLLAVALSWVRMQTAFGQIPVLSDRLLHRYLHRPWPFFLKNNTSTLLNRMTEQTNLVGVYMFNELAVLFAEILVVVAMLAFLTWLNPLVTGGLAVLLGVTGGLLYLGLRHSGSRLGAIRLAHQTDAFKTGEIAMTGAKEIRLNQSQDYFYRRFSTSTATAIHALATIMTVREIPRFVMEFVIVAGFLLLLGLLMARQTPTEAILSIAAVYAAASFRLLPSLNRISQALYHLRVGTPVFNSLYDDLKLTGESATAEARPQLPAPIPFHETITFDRVSYAYPGAERPSLADVSLTIRHNTAVGIVGPTGAGKTTLVELLCGLLTPDRGLLAVDGLPLAADTLPGWQRKIGYVPQSIYLYDDTIRRNIAFGIEDAFIDEATVQHAARLANIDAFIASLPQGYDTPIGDRGVKLSGGQRQRLGIARALYRNPDVLILDEATSALDTVTEAEVAAAIRGLSGQKTLLIIAHRLGTVRSCDSIVVMERGQVVSVGSYGTLEDSCAVFRQLLNPAAA